MLGVSPRLNIKTLNHLGSSSYLTDVNGMPTHYYEYLPFGEMMVEHNNSNFDHIYKFNAKELDEKTGYYYYGARYYNPRTSVFLSVDPLAEQFPGWTPYHYVHNNPINLIDPTGMSAQESDGWIVKNNTTQASYDPKYDGTNTPEGHYYGTAFELEGTVYNADGSTESSGGGISDCVSCHHTTTLGNGTANNSPYERYTIWGYNRTGGDDEKSMRGQNVNAISFRVSDVSLMGAGGASLKGLNSISQFAQILQNLTSATSGAVALGEDPNIKKAVKYMQRININFLPPSPYNNAAIHIGKPKDTLVDIHDINNVKKLNLRDSIREVSKYKQYLKIK